MTPVQPLNEIHGSLSQRIILLYLSKLMAVAVNIAILLSNPGSMDMTKMVVLNL